MNFTSSDNERLIHAIKDRRMSKNKRKIRNRQIREAFDEVMVDLWEGIAKLHFKSYLQRNVQETCRMVLKDRL